MGRIRRSIWKPGAAQGGRDALRHDSGRDIGSVGCCRAFLDRITMRIVELDRGVLRSYPGNFAASAVWSEAPRTL